MSSEQLRGRYAYEYMETDGRTDERSLRLIKTAHAYGNINKNLSSNRIYIRGSVCSK